MSGDTLEQFIADTFVSVWSLEILAHLIECAPVTRAPAVLVESLRASESVVSQGVDALVRAGLVHMDADGNVAYSPLNADLDECSKRSVEFYRRYPGRARRLIVARTVPSLEAFSSAFRIRKD